MNEFSIKEKDSALILAAFEEAIQTYAEERRKRVDAFVAKHFSIRETLLLQKKFFWADLLLYTINSIWSIPYLIVKRTSKALGKVGWINVENYFERIPSGIRTRYQKEIESFVKQELLEWSSQGALFGEIRKHPALARAIESGKLSEENIIDHSDFQKTMDEYSSSRTFFFGLTASLAALSVGWLIYGDWTLGVLGLGDHLARGIAKKKAVSHFFIGKSLGSAFYGIFPPKPSAPEVVLATLVIGFLFLLLGALAAVISDPLRKQLGLQKGKLHALIDRLEERLLLHAKRKIKGILLE